MANLGGVRDAARNLNHPCVVGGARLNEGMLNRVSAVVRAYDSCLSCSTHASGLLAVRLRLVDADETISMS